MKKFLFILLIFISGCANTNLEKLKEIDQENRTGLIEAYDEAMTRTKVERVEVENQYIDLQSNYDLVIMAYESVTGKNFEDISKENFLSLNELAEHRQKVEQQREERIDQIDESYSDFYKVINEAKDPKLMKAIEEIEKERQQTESGFFKSIFDVMKKILPF